MDELFLQILRANESAQINIAQTQESSHDNVNHLQVLKQNIDASELEKFELESLNLKNQTQQRIDKVISEAQATLESMKHLLEKDFKEISESKRVSLLKEVCEFHGE